MGYRATRFKLIGNVWYKRLFGGVSTTATHSNCPLVSFVSDNNPSRNIPFLLKGTNLHNINIATLNEIQCIVSNASPNSIEITVPNSFPSNIVGPFVLALYSPGCVDPTLVSINSVSATCPNITNSSFNIDSSVGRNVLVTFTGTNMNNTTQVFFGDFEIVNFSKTATTVSFTTPNSLPLQRNIYAFLYGNGSGCRINNTVAGFGSTFGPFTTLNT